MASYEILKNLINKTNKNIKDTVKENVVDPVDNWLTKKEEEQKQFLESSGMSPEAQQMAMDTAMSSPAMGIISPGMYKTISTGIRELAQPKSSDLVRMIEELQPKSYKEGRTLRDYRNDAADVGTFALKEKGYKTPKDVMYEMLGRDAERVYLPEGSGGFYDPATRLPYLEKKTTRNIGHHEGLHSLEDAEKNGRILDYATSSIYDRLLDPEVYSQIPGFSEKLQRLNISPDKLIEISNKNPDLIKKLASDVLESMPRDKAIDILEGKHFLTPTDGTDTGRVLDLITNPELSKYGNKAGREMYKQHFDSPGRIQGADAYQRLQKILKGKY